MPIFATLMCADNQEPDPITPERLVKNVQNLCDEAYKAGFALYPLIARVEGDSPRDVEIVIEEQRPPTVEIQFEFKY